LNDDLIPQLNFYCCCSDPKFIDKHFNELAFEFTGILIGGIVAIKYLL
jgi:hypothetical protein